jgi:hypothetical protein
VSSGLGRDDHLVGDGTKRSRFKSNGGRYLSSHDTRDVLGWPR